VQARRAYVNALQAQGGAHSAPQGAERERLGGVNRKGGVVLFRSLTKIQALKAVEHRRSTASNTLILSQQTRERCSRALLSLHIISFISPEGVFFLLQGLADCSVYIVLLYRSRSFAGACGLLV